MLLSHLLTCLMLDPTVAGCYQLKWPYFTCIFNWHGNSICQFSWEKFVLCKALNLIWLMTKTMIRFCFASVHERFWIWWQTSHEIRLFSTSSRWSMTFFRCWAYCCICDIFCITFSWKPFLVIAHILDCVTFENINKELEKSFSIFQLVIGTFNSYFMCTWSTCEWSSF